MARATLEHAGQEQAGKHDGSPKVDLEAAVDIAHFQVGQPAAHRHARVGDQDVYRACLGRQPLGLASAGEVGDHHTGATVTSALSC